MKKKIVVLLLSAMMAVSVVGCGSNKNTEDHVSATESVESTENAGTSAYESPSFDIKASDYVTLCDYDSIEVTIDGDYQVGEQEVKEYFAQMFSNYGPFYKADETKTTIEEGDIVNVDYVGKLDGEAFEGGTAENQNIDVYNNSSANGITGYIDGFRAYAAEHYLSAALIYVAATTAGCVLLALPGVCFAIVSGVLFGPVMGTLLCLVSATFGAVLSFLAGRFFLKDSVKPMLEKSPALKRFLFDNADGSALVLLMVTRLLPVFPYNLQNFAYGITDVGLLPYTIYTFVFMFPGVALFTVGAAGLSDAENRAGLMCAAAVFAVMLAFIGVFLYKRYLKRGRAA